MPKPRDEGLAWTAAAIGTAALALAVANADALRRWERDAAPSAALAAATPAIEGWAAATDDNVGALSLMLRRVWRSAQAVPPPGPAARPQR